MVLFIYAPFVVGCFILPGGCAACMCGGTDGVGAGECPIRHGAINQGGNIPPSCLPSFWRWMVCLGHNSGRQRREGKGERERGGERAGGREGERHLERNGDRGRQREGEGKMRESGAEREGERQGMRGGREGERQGIRGEREGER